jgi:hypothetical protein
MECMSDLHVYYYVVVTSPVCVSPWTGCMSWLQTPWSHPMRSFWKLHVNHWQSKLHTRPDTKLDTNLDTKLPCYCSADASHDMLQTVRTAQAKSERRSGKSALVGMTVDG